MVREYVEDGVVKITFVRSEENKDGKLIRRKGLRRNILIAFIYFQKSKNHFHGMGCVSISCKLNQGK